MKELSFKVIIRNPQEFKILIQLFLKKGGSWSMFEPRPEYTPLALIFRNKGVSYAFEDMSLSDFLKLPEELVFFQDAEIILRNWEAKIKKEDEELQIKNLIKKIRPIIKSFFFEFADRITIQKLMEKIVQFLYRENLFNEDTNPIVVGVNFFFEYSLEEQSFKLRILPEIDKAFSFKISVPF